MPNFTLIYLKYESYILEYKDYFGLKSWYLGNEILKLKENNGQLAYYSTILKKYFYRKKMKKCQ